MWVPAQTKTSSCAARAERAPGSMTGETTRMLENEPTGDTGGFAEGQTTEERTADAGNQGTASRPPGPPSADADAAAGVGAPPADQQYAVPAVTFQPPPVVFQPPDIPPPKIGDSSRQEDEAPGDEGPDDESGADDRLGRRRRRRGGRGRGRTKEGAQAETEADKDNGRAGRADETSAEGADRPAADAGDAAGEPAEGAGRPEDDEAQDGGEQQPQGSTAAGVRRRRRRRRRGTEDPAELGTEDPPNTVVRIREPRSDKTKDDAAGDAAGDDAQVRALKGSTRLEAKKQRRREGRDGARRRPSVLTESEFLARRESVERVMVVRQAEDRTQIAVLEDGVLVEHYVDRVDHQSHVGNVYLGKVQNVLPSMEAAFVDIGKGRNAVLYAGEVNFDATGLEGQPKRIESALKSGQSLLVQVTKDPIGHKGARLTSQISLPGRFLVYVPEGATTGISRKLPDRERRRLKQILKQSMPDSAGVIVRTAAEGATEDELSRDVARLTAQWETIQRKAKTANPPTLLYGEPDLTIRVVRDIFNEDFAELVVSGEDAWTMVEEYIRYVAPHLEPRVRRWTKNQDVLAAYRVDEQLMKALDRKVWLPSGGSVVIERTEAMTVIDVNTGKFTGQGGNLEETVTKNNLEAAEEIVRQLRLRDIGGIIVVDFIDMVLESNRELVLRRLLECLARDRTKHQVAEVTSLGLVQMTRKRVGQGLLEAFSESCECCGGRGVRVSMDAVSGKPERAGRRRRRGTPAGGESRTEPAEGPAEPPAEGPEESPAEAAQEAAQAAAEPVASTLEPVEAEPIDEGPRRGPHRGRRSRAAVE
ncbi:MAG: Rne/Rng family ribonuclease [Streptosporangiales bacterium]|nr:Rne/Rng family ribonuclease [Streptosporangiales bacterium]